MTRGMMMKVVALSGKMHSGKSYVAERLVEEYGFHHVSYAQAIKDDIAGMGFSSLHIKHKPYWMRQLLQAYGQARRAVNPCHWVDQVSARIWMLYLRRHLFEPEVMIVIDDMRFKNEMRALKELGEDMSECEVYFVRLHREGYDRTGIPGAEDASETDLDDVDLPEWTQKWGIPSGDLEGLNLVADDIAEVMGVGRSG
jgi:hypothetical protein